MTSTFQSKLKLAQGGCHYNQCEVGDCYSNGDGVDKDKKQAFQWFLKSANQNNRYGQNKVGCYYHDGVGVDKDEKQAFQWFLKSANQNHDLSQNEIGLCYRDGVGVDKDINEAIKWCQKAANQGYSVAQKNLDSLLFNQENNKSTFEIKKENEQHKANITSDKNINTIKPLVNWCESDVFNYFNQHPSLCQFASVFKEECLNGYALMNLTVDEMKSLGFKLGHIKNFQGEITKLSNITTTTATTTTTTTIIIQTPHIQPKRTTNRFGDGLDRTTNISIQFYESNYKPTKSITELLLTQGLLGTTALQSVEQKNYVSSHLSSEQAALIYLYTVESPFYKTLNKIMREGLPEERKAYKDYIYFLDHTLSLLRTNIVRHVYRGIDLILPDYTPGKTINWPAFSSTTEDVNVAIQFMGENKKGTLFVIKTKTAVPISQFSAVDKEMECLLASNTKLIIVSKAGDGTKKLLEKACNCDLSSVTIIELEEL